MPIRTLVAPACLLLASCASAPLGADHARPPHLPLILFSRDGGGAGIHRLAPNARPPGTLIVADANWPAPDAAGRRIAYQKRTGDQLDIWVCDPDGGHPLRLTNHPDHDYLPAFSPNGEWIVFTSWRADAGAERAPRLHIMRADGTDQRVLLPEPLGTSAGASWSPDGAAIVYGRRVGGVPAEIYLHAIDPLTGEPVGEPARLTNDDRADGAPVLSPDGARIAFYSDDGTASQIIVVARDGSGRRVLVEEGQNWEPRWSPDGVWIVFTRAVDDEGDLDLFAVRADGIGEPVPIVVMPGRQAEAWFLPVRD